MELEVFDSEDKHSSLVLKQRLLLCSCTEEVVLIQPCSDVSGWILGF